MEVYGTVHQTVYVEPLDVVKRLFKQEVGYDIYDVFFGEDEKGYFYEYEEYKYSKTKQYIEKEQYEYLTSLEIVIKKLENRQ